MAWCCNCNGKLVWQRQKGPSVWHMELSYLSWEYFRWNSCRYYTYYTTTQLLILEAIKCSLIWPRFTKNILGGRKLVTSHWLFIIKYYVKLQHELYFHEIFNNKKISMKFHEIFLNYYFCRYFRWRWLGLFLHCTRKYHCGRRVHHLARSSPQTRRR